MGQGNQRILLFKTLELFLHVFPIERRREDLALESYTRVRLVHGIMQQVPMLPLLTSLSDGEQCQASPVRRGDCLLHPGHAHLVDPLLYVPVPVVIAETFWNDVAPLQRHAAGHANGDPATQT